MTETFKQEENVTQPGFAPPDERAFQATVKAGKGYEASWIVVQARTAAELKLRLDEVQISGVLATAENLSNEYRAISAAAAGGLQPVQVAPPAPPQYAPPAPAPQGYDSPGPPPPWAVPAGAPIQGAPAVPVAAYAPQGYPSAPPAPPAPVATAGTGPPCAHGPRVWATGSGKTGRAWHAWDCSAKGSSAACAQDRLWAKQNGELSARN